jgi:hypothetical protein
LGEVLAIVLALATEAAHCLAACFGPRSHGVSNPSHVVNGPLNFALLIAHQDAHLACLMFPIDGQRTVNCFHVKPVGARPTNDTRVHVRQLWHAHGSMPQGAAS